MFSVFPDFKPSPYEYSPAHVGAERASDPYPDHPSGLAMDIMMPGGCTGLTSPDWKLGNSVAKFFCENHKRFGVSYIIWQQKIWNAKTEEPKPPTEWRGMSDRGSCTANHQDHVHITYFAHPNSKNWDGTGAGIKKGTYWDETNTLGLAANGLPPLVGSPKQIGEAMTAYARKNGWPGLSYAGATSADYSGHEAGSWHYGPYDEKWAGDFGDAAGSAACRKLAEAISEAWGMGWTWDKGLVNKRVAGYDLQLIYGNYSGHGDHVHFGVRVANRKKVYGNTGT